MKQVRTIEHWIGGTQTPGMSTRHAPVWNPATGEQQAQVLLLAAPGAGDRHQLSLPHLQLIRERTDERKDTAMRKVIVNEWMTLDGVVQAPGAADEDTSGGFKHGGWHLRFFDDISRKWVVENLTDAGGFLLGRRTYEAFAAHWPNAFEDPADDRSAGRGRRQTLPPR